jgi:hypothetical protein
LAITEVPRRAQQVAERIGVDIRRVMLSNPSL